jgi:hypothetical protein
MDMHDWFMLFTAIADDCLQVEIDQMVYDEMFDSLLI